MTTTTHCDDQARRRLLRERGRNGIDYVEVGDDRRTLTVHFLAAAPPRIEVRNVRVEGGPRVRPVRVTEVRLDEDDDPARAGRLEVTVDRPGDATTYTLRLVGLGDALDQRAARADFSFQVADPADLDPAMGDACPPPALVEPAISYLAKDYA
ncbi:MAG TPA: hypothetical protein VFL91_29190, partial [Thermomicrobiales bacterium]|nr:hypothetical protein [Thermomicrobiales bacterium]